MTPGERHPLAPVARAAVDGALVVGIGVQGAGIAACATALVLGWWELVGLERLGQVSLIAAVVGGPLAGAVAGWRVLGGWRGALRAALVVVICGAAGFATYHSPLLLGRGAFATLASIGAGLSAGAFAAVALLRRAAPAAPDEPAPRAPDAPSNPGPPAEVQGP